MTDIYQFFADNQIEYERHGHPPVYTVADVERLVPPLPAVKTKNLFLRNKKGRRHFLLAVPAQKRVDIKTSTLPISQENLRRFFGATGHEVRLLDIPSQDYRGFECQA